AVENSPTMKLRVAIFSVIPIALVFVYSAFHPQSSYYLAAGPLCGIACGLSFGKRWAMAIVLALCYATIGLMFSLQDARSALFSDMVWTGLVSGFLFWVAGGCAMLVLPSEQRFNGAAALAIPGALAGMAFQFLYGPAHYLFDLGPYPWEHMTLWLIASAGGGWLLGSGFARKESGKETGKAWSSASLACGLLGLGVGAAYFLRSRLPLGLFNSLSPSSALSDWFWGWGVLATTIGVIAAFTHSRRKWAAAGLALALTLVVASYKLDANPWKTRFNSHYADRLLRENAQSGDAIYAGNLILAQ